MNTTTYGHVIGGALALFTITSAHNAIAQEPTHNPAIANQQQLMRSWAQGLGFPIEPHEVISLASRDGGNGDGYGGYGKRTFDVSQDRDRDRDLDEDSAHEREHERGGYRDDDGDDHRETDRVRDRSEQKP